MRSRLKTVSKNFRFPKRICDWLSMQQARTGMPQTRLVLLAIEKTYGLKRTANGSK